jgi:hypothetical protein
VFIGVQALGAVANSSGPAADRARWIEPPPEIYQFSADRNVIHIVLDEFQSDVFTEILQQDRAALDKQFSGFVYFADHAGAFPTTSMAMPAMLTGLEYRNQKLAPEFVREAFRQSSIFEKVSRAGYDVDVMSIVPIASFEEWIGPEAAPNWKGARFRIRKPFISQGDYREVSARQLGELSLFEHVPHKAFSVERSDTFYRAIWMDRGDSPAQIRRHEATNSVAFLEHFTGLMSVGRDRPVYKLMHVGVPHRPVVVDRECRFIGLTDMSRESYTDQSRCAVKLVASLLDRVRTLGIYDSNPSCVVNHGTTALFTGKSDSLALLGSRPRLRTAGREGHHAHRRRRAGPSRYRRRQPPTSICRPRSSRFSACRADRPKRRCSNAIQSSLAHASTPCTIRVSASRRSTWIESICSRSKGR